MGRAFTKLLAMLLMVAVLLGAVWAGSHFLNRDYLFWNGTFLPRQAQHLDIRGKRMRNPEALGALQQLRQLDARDTGMTAGQYSQLAMALPECRILWDVPVQGRFYGQQTRELSVPMLTPEETALLCHFPELESLNVQQWQDVSAIRQLQQQYPELEIRCRVLIGGEQWDNDVAALVLKDPDVAELMEKLPLFSRLESVMLTGILPEQTRLKELQQQFPEIDFLWKMEALGMILETDMTVLDLTGVPLRSVEELASLLPYFPSLETVVLDSIGREQENMIALARENPQIQFVFDLTFGDRVFRTDAAELDLSNTALETTAELEEILPCFHNLEKVVMCQCGISNADMDALNRRYENIRFVWSVELGGMLFRTDAVHFTPNRWGLKLNDENIYDLRYCTDMVCVDIGHSTMVTNCDWVAFMPELKYLVLAETGISDLSPLSGHDNLVFLELFLSKVQDYSPLLTCKSLEDLNLCYTRGSWEPIAQMTWLKRLWWSGSWAARTALADKLPDTQAEYLSVSSTGKGWREGQHYYDMRDFIGMDYMVG